MEVAACDLSKLKYFEVGSKVLENLFYLHSFIQYSV